MRLIVRRCIGSCLAVGTAVGVVTAVADWLQVCSYNGVVVLLLSCMWCPGSVKGVHRVTVALSGVCLLLSSLSSLLSIGCLGLVVVVVVVVVAAQVCEDRGLVLDSHFVVEDSLWRGLLCTGTCASQSPPM